MKKWSLKEVENVLQQFEPKQIKLFKELLPTLKTEMPVMVELGAAEGFYSKMFNDFFTAKNIIHKNICLELSNHKIECIKENIPTAYTIHGYIGILDKKDADVLNETNIGLPLNYTLQQIVENNNLSYIDYLHVDIQGGENVLIDELILNSSLTSKIRYFFISTHNDIIPGIHDKCLKLLSQFNIIINSGNGNEKWGYADGLIVAENLGYNA
jgi:hypothetical protein